MASLLRVDIETAAGSVLAQLGDAHYSESVLQTALTVELQLHGYCVQTEVTFPVQYETSVGTLVTVGQVRVDILVTNTVDPSAMAVIEVKKTNAGNHTAQLTRYKRVLPENAFIALFSPSGLVWHP